MRVQTDSLEYLIKVAGTSAAFWNIWWICKNGPLQISISLMKIFFVLYVTKNPFLELKVFFWCSSGWVLNDKDATFRWCTKSTIVHYKTKKRWDFGCRDFGLKLFDCNGTFMNRKLYIIVYCRFCAVLAIWTLVPPQPSIKPDLPSHHHYSRHHKKPSLSSYPPPNSTPIISSDRYLK